MAGILEEMGGPVTDAESIKADPTTTNFNQLAGSMREPTDYTVSDNSLIRNQLSSLLSSESPYLESARARARTYANERGLLNSSLAATAGESAAIDAAMPIAQGDAATYGRADEFNATNRSAFDRDFNNFGREGAMAKYEGVLAQQAQDKTLAEQGRIANQDLALRGELGRGDLSLRGELGRGDLDVRRGTLEQQAADLALRRELGLGDLDVRRAGLDLNAGDLALRRDQLQQQIADAAQTQRTNVTGQIQAIRQQAIQARASLEANPNMDAGAKAAAIQALTAQASQDIRELIRLSGIDLPEEWPDWINDVGPTAPAPPPAAHTERIPGGYNDPAGPGGYGP